MERYQKIMVINGLLVLTVAMLSGFMLMFLLIGGLVHDYAYKYKTLLEVNKKKTMGELSQKRADEIFRDINIIVNGFYSMNYLAYWSLRIGGFVAWNGHRKRNNKIPELK